MDAYYDNIEFSSTPKNKVYHKKCKKCGKSYEGFSGSSVCPNCRVRPLNRLSKRKCTRCGRISATLTSLGSEGTEEKLCSEERLCSFCFSWERAKIIGKKERTRTLQYRPRKPQVIVAKQCPQCSRGFVTGIKKKRFCSSECSTKYQNIKALERYHLKHIKQIEILLTKNCLFCNKQFTTYIKCKKYCDKKCYFKKWHKNKHMTV